MFEFIVSSLILFPGGGYLIEQGTEYTHFYDMENGLGMSITNPFILKEEYCDMDQRLWDCLLEPRYIQ